MRCLLVLLSVACTPLELAAETRLPADDKSAAPPTVRVAGIVLKWIRQDRDANWRRVVPLIREAARKGAKIVCTTECFLDGYSIADKSIPLEKYRGLGEPVPGGPYFKRITALADELDVWLIAGILETDGDARFNAAVLIGPDGKLRGKYRKQKLGHELVRNKPGDSSPVFETPWGKVGVMICADRREPGIVRTFCTRGADLVICPSGGMFGSRRNDPIVQARSRENSVPIVFVHPAEFLVTGRDGSILAREIVGNRLLIAAGEEGGKRDLNKVFVFDVALKTDDTPAAALDVASALGRKILAKDQPLSEVQKFCEARVARLPMTPTTSEEWDRYAARLRSNVLDRVVLRGEAKSWRTASRRVEWLDTLPGNGYSIRKLRFEAVPGLWIPALLYVPDKLEGGSSARPRRRVPVVLNVNGHDGKGKAATYKQLRCIEMAKRGALALNVEWLGMGQLRGPGYGHYTMNQLDLCGTSGLAPFYLSMERSLDILLAHENADPKRVAVAGLSGGGWQTIFISSLDTRVTLSNPVAGYGSFLARARHFADLGDSEQTPCDLATNADYTHLTALLAPRPALLTFNAKDNCCFKAGHTLPPLLDAAKPAYALHGKPDLLRTQVNEVPGDHNFGQENRETLYAALADWFHIGGDRKKESTAASEVKSAEELHVELPEKNASFNSLAMALAATLPAKRALPETKLAALGFQKKRRELLRKIVHSKSYRVTGNQVASQRHAGGEVVTWWTLKLDSDWTLPAVEIARGTPEETVLLVADGGREALVAEIGEHLKAGRRVVALDPFYIGESRISQRPFLFALLIGSVGERPLGLQASGIAAVAEWLRGVHEQPVRVDAKGARTSLSALVAAALEPKTIASLNLRKPYGSLREVIEKNIGVNQAPEPFCFGLLKEFDIIDLIALTAPRRVSLVGVSAQLQDRTRRLEGWSRLLRGD